jgi:hypothetical protein
MLFGSGSAQRVGLLQVSSLHSVGMAAVMLAVGCSAAVAQTSADNKPDTAKQLVVTPHAPVARQIEPMVAPVRRVAPGATVASAPKPAAAVATVQAAGKAPAGPQLAITSSFAPTAVSAAPIPKVKGPVASVPPPASVPAASAITATPVAVARTAPATVKVTQPKYVAYTCKLGEDYSVQRKVCFTPGIKTAAVAAKASPAAKTAKLQPKPALDTAERSALGAKP